ncbi:hypothetical protein DH2020_002807 [Rehmannia glutinosa]|uniref:Late embryogenesis abundant protein LEA-2 subgroup domain-containing protein n=1 Tax=Rehmannia glutinosa TaxID=99300 RepID=A0ABR0XUS0_REHGL
MAMVDNKMESEEEALFRSYPYAVYFVQSPSTISHTTNIINYDHLTAYHSPDNNNFTQLHPTNNRLALSAYSSSRGSNNSFAKKKYYSHSHDGAMVENGEKSGGIVKIGVHGDDRDRCVLEDEDDEFDLYDDEKRKIGWIKYFSFSYSNSGWWILLQLSWRFLLSLIIALLVFYVAAKPPPPRVSIKIAGIRQFRLGEGVDGSGVTTKILSCNCSLDLIIDNNSKLFDLHIHPPTMELLFGHLPFAISQGKEVDAGSDDITLLRLNVGTRNKPMYGAGRNMQDLLASGKGLPLVIRVSLRSSFHVIWGLFQPKFHHQPQCLVVLSDKYDKKHRTQVFNSTCIVNS